MNESTLIARLEKFAGQKIKPGRNTIKGFPVDIEDNPDGDYIEMSAVDLDASKSLTKLLRKAGFKAKATKTEILISEGTTKSTKIFKEFALGSLSESVAVDTDTFVGAHGKKPKGNGSWIFFADKYKTDIRKDDYYQTPHAMNYGDAVKLAKKWAAEKKLFRIYAAS